MCKFGILTYIALIFLKNGGLEPLTPTHQSPLHTSIIFSLRCVYFCQERQVVRKRLMCFVCFVSYIHCLPRLFYYFKHRSIVCFVLLRGKSKFANGLTGLHLFVISNLLMNTLIFMF